VAKADPVVVTGAYSAPTGSVIAIPIMIYNDTTSGANNAPTGINLNAQIYQFADGTGSTTGAPFFVLGTPAVGLANNSGYVGSAGNQNAGGNLIGSADANSGPVPPGSPIFNVNGHTIPGDGGVSNGNSLSIAMNFPATTIPNGLGQAKLLATLYISTQGVAGNTNWALNLGGGFVLLNTDDDPPTVIKDYGQPGNAVPDNGPTNFGDLGAYNTKIQDGTIHVTPEPSSVVLGLLAAAGLALVVRRRKARA